MRKLIYILLFLSTLAQAQGVTFSLYEQNIKANDTVRAEVSVSGFNQVTTFQWGLLFDTAALELSGLTFTGVLPDYSQECCFGLYSMGYLVEPGEIRSTWVDLWGLTIPENSHVFTMVFVAKKPGKLSESLTTYPQGMSLHAWTVPIVEVPLQWVFLEIIKTGPMQCYVSQKVIERAQESVPLPAQKIDFAAYPNPTTGNVTLTLPTAGRVTVFDALGRMESETEGIEGANGITLTGATGLKLIKFQGTVKTIIKQ